MSEDSALHQHWRNALTQSREAAFCLTMVDWHWLKVSQAWREAADARAIVLTVEPSLGRIGWQVADQEAVLEIGAVFKEHRPRLDAMTERFEGFMNWVVGVFDQRRVFLQVARTREAPKGVQ
jgi:hypothetical protein